MKNIRKNDQFQIPGQLHVHSTVEHKIVARIGYLNIPLLRVNYEQFLFRFHLLSK